MQIVIGLVVAVVGFLFVRGLASAPGATGGGGATRTRVIVPSPSVPPLPVSAPGTIGRFGWTTDAARGTATSMKAAGLTPAQVIDFLDTVPPPPPVGRVDPSIGVDTCGGRPDCGASHF